MPTCPSCLGGYPGTVGGRIGDPPTHRRIRMGTLEELAHERRRVLLHKSARLCLWHPSGRTPWMPKGYSVKGPTSSRDESTDLLAVGVTTIPTIESTTLLPSRQAATPRSRLLRFWCAAPVLLVTVHVASRVLTGAITGMVRTVPWPPTLEEGAGRTGSHAHLSGIRAGRSMTCPTLAPRPDPPGEGRPAIRRNPR